MSETYESIQQEAKGPGVEEWRQADKLRAGLTSTYQSLKDDPRYSEEHKSEKAWDKYEETRAQIERLAPEAREKMLRSAEVRERLSIPTPEHEGLITNDTDKLLLTAHERSRLEGLISRAEKSSKGPFKTNPADILKREYARGLGKGGPGGGATVRAVYELARDWELDIHQIVDEHRKPYHHGALEDAQRARMQADVIGKSVPKPPFPQAGAGRVSGTYSGGHKALLPRIQEASAAKKRRRPLWK